MNILYRNIMDTAKTNPDKIAIYERKRFVTYEELWKRICTVVAFFRENGLKKGDIAVISAVSSIDFAVVFIAVQAVGGTCVPIDRSMRSETVDNIISTVQAKFYVSSSKKKGVFKFPVKIFCYRDISEYVAPLDFVYEEPSINPEDVAEIIFTTGTTGKPKGAVHTYHSISANMQMTYEGVGIKENDIILIPISLCHSYGLRVFRSSFFAGATVVLQNGALFFDEIEKNINNYSCTGIAYISVGIEMMFSQLGRKRVQQIFQRLRYMEFSAGALPLNMRILLKDLLPNTDILNTWGSTETGGCLYINISKDPNITSAGHTINGAEVRLASIDGKRFVDGQEYGRLALKGEMLMKEYIGMTKLTEESFLDGYIITGDIVSINDKGYVFFMGRADDIINCGGEKISPAEIEQCALKLGGIEEAVCVGVKDKTGFLGEVPIIFVKPCDALSFSSDALKSHFVNNLDRYKIPVEIICIDDIPHNSIGKVERKKMKTLYESRENTKLDNPVIQTIITRRSVRDFSSQSVSKEMTDKLIEAGTLAPSGRNTRTRKFIVLSSESEIQSLRSLIKEVAQREKTSFHGFNEPKLMILIANDRRNRDGIQDVACAAENIMLACHSFGLGSVWINSLMNICDVPEIRERLNLYGIPSSYVVWAALAIGYPRDALPDFERKKEEVIYVGGNV